jgi:DNA ligase-1
MAKRKQTKKFPTLYKNMSNGMTQQWDIQVKMNSDNLPEIICTHGVVDGKQVKEVKLISSGKNIGKANETTPWEQAVSEAQSTWTKKKDKGYRETQGSDDILILPMLAREYSKAKHRIIMPCHVQPKLNGVRCISSLNKSEASMMSRGGKPILKFAHLREEIKSLLESANQKGLHLDGEIYKPGMSLQKISGATRKEKDDLRTEIDSVMEYHVYDCFNPGRQEWAFADRTEFLNKLVNAAKLSHVKFVTTIQVKSEGAALNQYKKWVAQGFEGIMFRNADAPYKIGSRSMDLQKHKPFVDSEFVIVGAHEGSGNDAGTVVWECITKKKKVFSVKPEGDRATRRDYWDNWKQYVGKELTVKYQELSDDGVPIFPVGVVIRDYE